MLKHGLQQFKLRCIVAPKDYHLGRSAQQLQQSVRDLASQRARTQCMQSVSWTWRCESNRAVSADRAIGKMSQSGIKPKVFFSLSRHIFLACLGFLIFSLVRVFTVSLSTVFIFSLCSVLCLDLSDPSSARMARFARSWPLRGRCGRFAAGAD